MTVLEEVVVSGVSLAAFAYLTTWASAYLWGLPPLNRRLLRALELGRAPPRLAQPLRSLSLWTLLGVLAFIELAVGKAVANAVMAGDSVGVIIVGGHFILAVAWLVYLRAKYARRRGSDQGT